MKRIKEKGGVQSLLFCKKGGKDFERIMGIKDYQLEIMSKIHLLVRALILDENKVLLAKGEGYSHTFLPGGHVEVGENIVRSLEREIMEELGLKVTIQKYLGVIEHLFEKGDNYQHEINHIFL